MTFLTNKNLLSEDPETVLAVGCVIDGTSGSSTCSDCPNYCPEWSNDDVRNVLRSQIKFSAMICIVLLVYSSKSVKIGQSWFLLYRDYREEYI